MTASLSTPRCRGRTAICTVFLQHNITGSTVPSSRSLRQVCLRPFATSTTPTARTPTFRRRAPTATFMAPRKVVETRPASAGWYTRRRRLARSPCSTTSRGIPLTDIGRWQCWFRAMTAISTGRPIREARKISDLSSRSLPREPLPCSTASTASLGMAETHNGLDTGNRRQFLWDDRQWGDKKFRIALQNHSRRQRVGSLQLLFGQLQRRDWPCDTARTAHRRKILRQHQRELFGRQRFL